jgi:hypothetical protein
VDCFGWSAASLAAVAQPRGPGQAHQPGDALATHSDVLGEPQLGVHPRRPISTPRHLVDVDDGVGQVYVGEVPARQRTPAPLLVARTRHSQHPAGHRDIDVQVGVVGEFLDQPERYFGRTFSRAK